MISFLTFSMPSQIWSLLAVVTSLSGTRTTIALESEMGWPLLRAVDQNNP
jgi:hypothetical protein